MFWAVVLLLLTALIFKQWLSSKSLNLPPGPRGLPLIGHFHLLGRLPHISLQELSKKFGPLLHLRLGSVPLVVVSSPAMAKAFLKTHDTEFAYRPRNNVVSIVTDYKTITFAHGDYWKKLRKLCTTELFTATRVSMNTQIIRDELWELSRELLRASEAGQVVGVRSHLKVLNFNIMTRILMKKSYFGAKASGDPAIAKEALDFMDMIDEILEVGASFSITDYFPYLSWLDLVPGCARVAGHKMNGFLQKVLDEQRPGEVPHDFMEITKSCLGNDAFNLKALLLDLLVAGSETSSTVSEWALAELLHHPDWIVKAQQEIESVVGRKRMVEEADISKLEVVNAIIKETFRLHPPLSLLLPHASIAAHKVAGYDIPKNTMLLVNVYAIGRDPQVWSDPLEFQPQRFIGSNMGVHGQDFELLPFGSGKRSCPGLPLGLRTVQLVLSNLLHGFEWDFSSSENDQPMGEVMGFVNFMAHTLKARIRPRLDEDAYTTLKLTLK